MKQILLASAIASSLILAGCSSSSSDNTAQDVINSSTVTVSGTVSDATAPTANTTLTGAKVECIYTGSLPCSSNTTDTSGNYSVTVLKSTDFYLRVTKTDYITINSSIRNLTADDSGNDIGLPLISDALVLINTAFSTSGLTKDSAAWLVVDTVDVNGNRVAGATVNASPGAGSGNSVFPDCNTGANGSTNTSTTPCTPPNDGFPAYLAKYSTQGEVTVTVNFPGGSSQTQRGFLTTGEVLYMEFEQ